MQFDTDVFVVWAHRSATSIFGAKSNPVVVNGTLLWFKSEQEARAESDRLNARSGGSAVHYSVKPIHVRMKRPNGFATGDSIARH